MQNVFPYPLNQSSQNLLIPYLQNQPSQNVLFPNSPMSAMLVQPLVISQSSQAVVCSPSSPDNASALALVQLRQPSTSNEYPSTPSSPPVSPPLSERSVSVQVVDFFELFELVKTAASEAGCVREKVESKKSKTTTNKFKKETQKIVEEKAPLISDKLKAAFEKMNNILHPNSHIEESSSSNFSIIENYRKRKLESAFSSTSNIAPALKALKKMYNSKETSDMTFIVGEEKILGNKAYLANRLDVFDKMMYGMMNRELTETNTIKIEGTTPNAFKKMLEYLYTGEIQLNNNDIIDIYLLADRYLITELRDICRAQIKDRLSSETALPFLINMNHTIPVKGEGEEIDPVLREIFEYTLGNAEAIFNEKNEYICSIRSELMWTILKSDVNLCEVKIMKLVALWLNFQKKDKTLLVEAKKFLRLDDLTQKEYQKFRNLKVWDEDFFSRDEIVDIMDLISKTNRAKNPRKLRNIWLISQCKEPFNCENLGDYKVKLHFNFTYEQFLGFVYFTTSFKINDTTWKIKMSNERKDANDSLVFTLALLDNKSSIREFDTFIETYIINQNLNKNLIHKFSGTCSSTLFGLNCSDALTENAILTKEKGFLNDGKLLVQAKIKLVPAVR